MNTPTLYINDLFTIVLIVSISQQRIKALDHFMTTILEM